MSHCLHVHLSQKRQCGVYRSLLNMVWHYKYVCGANAKHEHCRGLYDQHITMGQAIFCGLPELDLAFLRCQPSIQIVRHALFKKVFRVVFQSNKLKRHTGCVSYVFIIMCFGVSICCLNKTKNKDFLGDSVTRFF